MASDRYIFYIDVGDLPSAKVEEYLEKMAQKFREGPSPFFKPEEKVLAVAVRHEGTRVEKLP